MRAAVVQRYGAPDVVRVVEVPAPEPRAGQVLVRVHAAAVTAADARIRAAHFPRGFAPVARILFGLRRPRRSVLGGTFSGVVESVAPDVTDLAPGDEVCGMTGLRLGTHAELVATAADRVVRKPGAVSHDDAAGVLFGGTTALHFLRDRSSVRPGSTVLVNGASGAVGSNAVQLARHFGAEVTGVTSTANAELVRDLGATHVVDHTRTPLSQVDTRFDVVLDSVGTLTPDSGRRLLQPDGVLLLAVADLWQTITSRGNVRSGSAPERPADWSLLLDLVAAGTLRVVVDRTVPLDDVVAAHARVDSGHKVGNLIVHP